MHRKIDLSVNNIHEQVKLQNPNTKGSGEIAHKSKHNNET